MSKTGKETICNNITSEFGEDIVVIRHDVDNIYGIYRSYRFPKLVKAFNYSFMSIISISSSFRYLVPFYLEHIPIVMDIEKHYSATATYFFRPITVPRKNLVKELKSRGHELAYHSDRNMNYKVWFNDLKFVEKKLDTKVQGFTKHGYSIIRSGGLLPLEILIEYANKAELKYIGIGLNQPTTGLPHKINNIWVFDHEITLKFTPWNKLKEYIKNCIPLILVHPEDLFIPGEMDKFEYILSKKKGVSIIKFLKIFEKIINEGNK